MGCGLAKSSAAKSATVQPEPLRRRLTVDALEDVEQEKEQIDAAAAEENRSLLLELSQEQLMDLIKADAATRKYSIGSQTDSALHRCNSFSSKQMQFKGDLSLKVCTECIGYACKKGLKPESPNQDSFFICKVEGEYSIYAVFDGHGKKGHDVSNFVKEHLPKILLGKEDILNDPMAALTKAFDKTQRLIEQATVQNQLDANRSGCTASVILHDHKKDILYMAHVGDSRCVLAKKDTGSDCAEAMWKAVDLTEDHKPDLPAEKARIERCGGEVKFDGCFNYRVYAKGKRYPGLNMSRAMGDLMGFHDAGISAVPDVAERAIDSSSRSVPEGKSTKADLQEGDPILPCCVDSHTADLSDGNGTDNVPLLSPGSSSEKHGDDAEDSVKRPQSSGDEVSFSPSLRSHSIDPLCDKFVLLCSDGVWEFMSSAEAVQFTSKFQPNEAMNAAEELSRLAWDRWMSHMDGEVVDDITALVVHLDVPSNSGANTL